MKTLRWLIFDADGTLFNYEAAEKIALGKAFRAFSIPDTLQNHELYRKFNSALWDRFELGLVTSVKLRELRFEHLLKAIGIDADPQALSRRYLQELGNLAPLLPGAREIVAELAPDYGLVLATNGISDVQRRRLALSGLERFFEAVVISDEIGVAKPHGAYFDELFRRIGEPPRRRAMIIGDKLSSDIAGGVRAGIRTCWFNPSGEACSDEIQPEFEISDFRGLRAILRRIELG